MVSDMHTLHCPFHKSLGVSLSKLVSYSEQ